ncbi:MAG: tyrosine-protein phosphatase [Deltaproteobacteria bacterium]|nr:tyrosine-protein phosphatase [Deltaproteobacteria bacterium]
MRIAAPLLVVLLTACSATPEPPRHPIASAPTSATAQTAPRDDLAGLSNFAQVSPVLYRGAQPTAVGFRTLKALGVRTIVNLRSAHSDRETIAGLGLRYVELPSQAWNPQSEVVAQVLAIVRDPANAPVFVHCQHGADRTGYTIASYRIVEQGWDKDSALRELRRFGFHAVWGAIPSFITELDAPTMRERVRHTRPPGVALP